MFDRKAMTQVYILGKLMSIRVILVNLHYHYNVAYVIWGLTPHFNLYQSGLSPRVVYQRSVEEGTLTRPFNR